MTEQIFTNEVILSWLQYYAKNATIDLEHVKIIDITKKNKNIIPTVESHKTTMVFSNARSKIFFTDYGMQDWESATSGTTRVRSRKDKCITEKLRI